MSIVRFQVAVSLDGYMAGPDQSEEAPLGVGGVALHEWVFDLAAWRAVHGQDAGEVNTGSHFPSIEDPEGQIVMGIVGGALETCDRLTDVIATA